MSASLLLHNAEVGGQPGMEVRVERGQVLQVGPRLGRRSGEAVLDAAGGAVIPGLHDHHVHLRALIAARQSVDASPAADPREFDRLIAESARPLGPGLSLRVIGWHEASAGPLDRYRLDKLSGTVPVRVQHRSGVLWVLNSAALRQAGADHSDLAGIERDERGVATGRLIRMDRWLRDRLGSTMPAGVFRGQLATYARQAACLGLTGFTDATPDRDQSDVDEFASLAADGVVPQRLVLMAPPGLSEPLADRVSLGPHKVILDDATLPSVAELAELARSAHRAGSRVALHCVTAEQLVLATAALEQAGGVDGDRIEHASVVPPGYPGRLARLGAAVVTQPGFIGVRGDSYIRHVSPDEQTWLYPCATLLRSGVVLAAGSDAPFGPWDPWQCVASAVTRRTPAGAVIGPGERITPLRALRLSLAAPDDLSVLRRVAPGQPGDLCVLRVPLRMFLSGPTAEGIRAGIVAGQVFERT